MAYCNGKCYGCDHHNTISDKCNVGYPIKGERRIYGNGPNSNGENSKGINGYANSIRVTRTWDVNNKIK